MTTIGPRQLAHQLDLLCKAGIGIEAIAHDTTVLIRQLVGAEAAAIFWLNETGLPDGFYHEDSPAQVQSLFLDEFERLFVGQDEINVFALARHRGRRVGNLILPPAGYFKSNTFNLLVRPSGHEHTLDLRVDVDGKTRAVVLLFRSRGGRFGDEQARRLESIAPYLERAIRSARPQLDCRVLASGHVLVNADGSRVLMHSQQAADILKDANRVGTGTCKANALTLAPPFVAELCAHVHHSGFGRQVEREFAVPGGRLTAHATALLPASGSDATDVQVLIELKLMQPRRLEVVRKVVSMRLSPTQREIALLAGLGHPRADCLQVVGISKEALKKHLKAVYSATGANDWDSLHRTLAG